MVQSAIEASFTCSCGAPLIVMTLDQAPNNKVTALVMCSNHKIGNHLTLDHSALDLWIGVVADHLFRCAICSRPLMPVTGSSSSEIAISFTLTCPIHGIQKNTRTVWKVLYHRLVSEIEQQRGLKPTPKPPVPKQPSKRKPKSPAPPQPKEKPLPAFCPQCGKNIQANDEFCYHCGAEID